MSLNKYTRSGPGQHGRFKIYRNDKFMGSFEKFEDCESVCHILNKSDSQLTQEEVDLAINMCQDDINHYNGYRPKDEDIPRLQNIIKFLESLEPKPLEDSEHLNIRPGNIIDFIQNECIDFDTQSASANEKFLEIINSLKHMEQYGFK